MNFLPRFPRRPFLLFMVALASAPFAQGADIPVTTTTDEFDTPTYGAQIPLREAIRDGGDGNYLTQKANS